MANSGLQWMVMHKRGKASLIPLHDDNDDDDENQHDDDDDHDVVDGH